MCLDVVNHRNFPPLTETGIGYKCFMTNELLKEYYTPLQRSKNGPFIIGEWVEDDNKYSIECDGLAGGLYMSGFHIFSNINAALWFANIYPKNINAICKVEYTNIVAVGAQSMRSVIVARKIRIIEQCV